MFKLKFPTTREKHADETQAQVLAYSCTELSDLTLKYSLNIGPLFDPE